MQTKKFIFINNKNERLEVILVHYLRVNFDMASLLNGFLDGY